MPAANQASPVQPDYVVSAVGMVSPVGANATQTFTSVRANLSRKRECPQVFECRAEDPDSEPAEPLVASAIGHLTTSERDQEQPARWLAFLAAHAFSDLWENASFSTEPNQSIGLYCSLPKDRPAFGVSNQPEFLSRFHDLVGKDAFAVEHFEFGHSGTALGLCEMARAHLREGRIRHAIVGGADSYLFSQWLNPLDENYRIKSTRNLDGFCPGETAAFLLLEEESQARQRGLVPWATLAGASKTNRVASIAGHDAGEALANAIKPLLSDQASSPLLLCDLNGERDRFKGWGYALSRLRTRLTPPVALEHPAMVLGDVGAATGAVLIALGVRFLHTKYRERDHALIWCASDSGERNALLLRRHTSPTGGPFDLSGGNPCP